MYGNSFNQDKIDSEKKRIVSAIRYLKEIRRNLNGEKLPEIVIDKIGVDRNSSQI